MLPDVFVPNIVESVAMERIRGSLTLELEDNQAIVVSRREEVQLGVSREYPEPVVLPPERLYRRALRHIPHADRLVLSTRDDQLVPRMEKRRRNVVKVSATGVDLPRLRVAHPPEFDLPVIRRRHNQWQRRMECRPIDAAVVALEHVLDRAERVEALHGEPAPTAG